MEQAVKLKSDFETRDTRRQMVDMTTFNSINFQRWKLCTIMFIIHSNYFRFWLVKTTRIIHHNQLLLTKYWTNDVKSAARFKLLNPWRQKCSRPLQIIEPFTKKTWGWACVIFGEQKNKGRNGENPLRKAKYFESIKQLLNSAFVGYEEFCRSRRVLSTLAFGQNSSYPTRPHSIIAKNDLFRISVVSDISHIFFFANSCLQ